MTRLSVGAIRLYQKTLGPVLGMFSSCRFTPTCSEYGRGALERFGFWRGWWLTIRRIGRCRPYGGSGHDPVPEGYVGWRAARGRRREAS